MWNCGGGGTEGILVLNRGIFGVELGGGGTEGFLVWNCGILMLN